MARFVKGQSGNPGGRPKALREIRAAALEHGRTALETLVECLSSDDDRVRVVAANSILDRAYGKPAQVLTGDADKPLVVVTEDARSRLLGRLAGIAARAGTVEGVGEPH